MNIKYQDGGFVSDLYKNSNCYVGYRYIRFTASTEIKPCCIFPSHVGHYDSRDWRRVWQSGAMAEFRAATKNMAKDQMHLKQPEWAFCQQCPHKDINIPAQEQIDHLKKASS